MRYVQKAEVLATLQKAESHQASIAQAVDLGRVSSESVGHSSFVDGGPFGGQLSGIDLVVTTCSSAVG